LQFATFYFLFPVLLQIMSLLQKESFPHSVRQLLNLAEILESNFIFNPCRLFNF